MHNCKTSRGKDVKNNNERVSIIQRRQGKGKNTGKAGQTLQKEMVGIIPILSES